MRPLSNKGSETCGKKFQPRWAPSNRLFISEVILPNAPVKAINAFESVIENEQNPAGLVRLAMANDLFHDFLAPAICSFLATWPDIKLDIRFMESWVDLHKEPFDLDMRIGEPPDSSFVARKLGESGFTCYVAPSLLSGYQPVTQVKQIAALPAIIIAGHSEEWEMVNGEKCELINTSKKHVCNTVNASLTLTLAGQGVTLLPEVMVTPYVQSGQLVNIMPGWATPPRGLYIIMPNKNMPLRVRLLVEYLAEEFDKLKDQAIKIFENSKRACA